MTETISRLECIEVSGPGGDNRERFCVVVATASDGTQGFAEAAASPSAVHAYITGRNVDDWDAGPMDVILGMDATDPQAAWEELEQHTFWSARSGLGYVAVAAIDTALWDLAGRIKGRPAWSLVPGSTPSPIKAYATLYHGPGELSETIRNVERDAALARELGFLAVKVEAMPSNTRDLPEIAELVRRSREAVGNDTELMLDVGYRWTSARDALSLLESVAECNLRFLEAPFPPELREEYKKLVAGTQVPIASGDMLTSALDYDVLLDSGVSIVQAGAARTGFSGMRKLAQRAAKVEADLVPWGFSATAFAAAANIHASMTIENVPMIECVPPEIYKSLPRRQELGSPHPGPSMGYFDPPTAAGYGVDMETTTTEGLRS